MNQINIYNIIKAYKIFFISDKNYFCIQGTLFRYRKEPGTVTIYHVSYINGMMLLCSKWQQWWDGKLQSRDPVFQHICVKQMLGFSLFYSFSKCYNGIGLCLLSEIWVTTARKEKQLYILSDTGVKYNWHL